MWLVEIALSRHELGAEIVHGLIRIGTRADRARQHILLREVLVDARRVRQQLEDQDEDAQCREQAQRYIAPSLNHDSTERTMAFWSQSTEVRYADRRRAPSV